MTKREKVLKGLDLCLSGEAFECKDCPYDAECKEAKGISPSPLRRDALDLLKEQEPVKAIPTRLKVVRTYNDIEYNYCCGGCSSFLLDKWVACPICGKVVNWE